MTSREKEKAQNYFQRDNPIYIGYEKSELKPYLIHIWGPFVSREQEIVPEKNTPPDDTALIFAHNAQQANDLGYFFSVKTAGQIDLITYFLNYQVIQIIPNQPFVVTDYDELIEFHEGWLLDLEGIGAKVDDDFDYESTDQHIYTVEIYKTSVLTDLSMKDLENRKPDTALYVSAANSQDANSLALIWAEVLEIIDPDNETIETKIIEPKLPIGFWNPIIKFEE